MDHLATANRPKILFEVLSNMSRFLPMPVGLPVGIPWSSAFNSISIFVKARVMALA